MKFLVILTFVALALSQSCPQPCAGVADGGEPKFRANWKSLNGHSKCYGGRVYVDLNPEENFSMHGGYSVEHYPFRKTSYSAYPVTFEEAGKSKVDSYCQAYLQADPVGNEHGYPITNHDFDYLFKFSTQTWGPGYPLQTQDHTRRTNRFPLGIAACCLAQGNPCGESRGDLTGTGLVLVPFANTPKERNYFVTSGYPYEGNGKGIATQLSDFKFRITGGDYCGDTSSRDGKIYVVPLEYQGKVRICHRTSAVSNPYVSIEVSWNAVDGDTIYNPQKGDHRTEHTGPVFDPHFDYASNAKDWGDIIPPIEDLGLPGVNWEEGQHIWENDCQLPRLAQPEPQPQHPITAEPEPHTPNDWEDIWNDISCGPDNTKEA